MRNEVEHNVKSDGTLTAMCNCCCERNIQHKYSVYKELAYYDVISFNYQDQDDPEVGHTLHWLEEKSCKE